MRRLLGWLLGLAIVAAGLVAVGMRIPAVQDFAMRRLAARRMAAPPALFDDDALRVLICGSASPLPHPTRARPCVAIFAGGRFWVVDTGPGSWNRLALWQIDGARIGGVVLTHFHSDHIGELGEFNMQTWVAGRGRPLRVFGPPGVERVVAGFAEAYALDASYRTAHHGADFLPPEDGRMEAVVVAEPAAPGEEVVVLDEGGLRITAVAVDHAPIRPAYAYRFEFGGRSAVVSGDTVRDDALIALARDADVLVHEAQANHLVALLREAAARAGRERIAKILGDIPDYHTSPEEAAAVANDAGVDLLVLYHLTPPPTARLVERAFVRGVDAIRPTGWVLADDGLLVTLPVGSSTIDVGWIE